MTNKERVHAVLEGKPVDRFPVTAIYNFLYYADHFAEVTGEPEWRLHAWKNARVEQHMAVYRAMIDKAPFELLQPHSAPSREWRNRQEFLKKDGKAFRHDTKTDGWYPLDETTRSGHATDCSANEEQRIYNKHDVDEHVLVNSAEDMLATGCNDYIEATVAEFGSDQFILSGGVIGTVYSCSSYLGLTRLFELMIDDADLVDYLCAKILEQNIETIRQLAAAGGDAIYIDDATSTCDMISVEHYERFSLPYMKVMVEEIHKLGHKAILIYFGGIADRLEQIASIGADGLVMETSMKGYVNDIQETVSTIGDQVTLFANIDPVGVLQNGTDAELEAEIRRQCCAGQKGRGFIISTSSPIPSSSVMPRQISIS